MVYLLAISISIQVNFFSFADRIETNLNNVSAFLFDGRRCSKIYPV